MLDALAPATGAAAAYPDQLCRATWTWSSRRFDTTVMRPHWTPRSCLLRDWFGPRSPQCLHELPRFLDAGPAIG